MPPRDPAADESDILSEAVRCPRPGERVHMLGIGGVGMAGLALLLKSKGWDVSGCDTYTGSLLNWLNDNHISTAIGHHPSHLDTRPAFLVRSPAVAWSDPELQEAVANGVPVIDRGRLLPELLKSRDVIAVAGTHGKTTTSSMVAWFLASAGCPHSYCIGGVCPGLGAVARVDADGWMVVEADESDGTLKYYAPKIGVITSMDLDHVDYYYDHSRILEVFGTFTKNAGKLVVPDDDPVARSLARDDSLTFGFGETATFRASQVVLSAERSMFDLSIKGTSYGTVHLSAPGRHNISNALAALAAGHLAGLEVATMIRALAGFRLPKRRFEEVARGRGIRVLSDYAHHPVEIAALLNQARLSKPQRVIAVFQPHRYSRTKAFRESFVDVLSTVDELILAPVYSASEPFIEGGTSDELFASFRSRGFDRVIKSLSLKDAWSSLQRIWREGDLVLLIGAGDVDQIGMWAGELLGSQCDVT